MNFVVVFDKLVEGDTWVVGLHAYFEHQPAAAKFARQLNQDPNYTNAKIHQTK